MYEVLDSSDSNWNKYLGKFPLDKCDIYFTSQYYQLAEMMGNGIGKLFYYEDTHGNKGFYPFMLNRINIIDEKEYFDIETAYGYGGPVIQCVDDIFYCKFESKFIEYCHQNGIVAEFIRFHPLIENQKTFKKNISTEKNRTTISINLHQELQNIWLGDLKSENRTRIRKAQKNGLYIEVSSDYKTFKDIYEHTMEKVDARKEYIFNDDYYLKLSNMKNSFLVNVLKNNKVIASGCFIWYGDYLHYHLGGSLTEYLNLGPNNLMMWEAIKYGKELGCKILHLGGGLTDEPQDNLFRFKKSFSKDCHSFFIGKRVHNTEIYKKLINNWEKSNNEKANLFLQYRL